MPRCTIFACLVIALGCQTQERLAEVKGRVTLDSHPLAEGEVSFITAGLVPEVLPIVKGEFQGKVRPGERRIEIRAYRMGKPFDMGGVIIEGSKENFIPARYNDASEFKADVKLDTPNDFQFAMTLE